MNPTAHDLVAVAEKAARSAGLHALEKEKRRTEVFRRFDHDVKLQLDLECQAVAESVIRGAFPDHAILGEESSVIAPDAPIEWVVDPIDGTINFFHGLPLWCCSVAATREGRTVAGVVYAPVLNECFVAVEDGPALCNGKPVTVSGIQDPRSALIATGALNRPDDGPRFMALQDGLLPRVQKIRMMGSAALDLCHVACGRVEGYVELAIFPWDIAAGRLLVERAGGTFEVLRAWEDGRYAVLASNRALHSCLREWAAPVVLGESPFPHLV